MPRIFGSILAGLLAFSAIDLVAGLTVAKEKPLATRDRPPAPTLGKALSAVFNAKRESKGTLQRSLPPDANMFDVIAARKKDLQIAFVVDGTDSMGRDINSALETMRSIVTGLRSPDHPDGTISFALLVYRDAYSPSGKVELPIRRFTSDVTKLEAALAKVKTESGAPYFRELVDVGLHSALTELDWAPTDAAEVTRWIIVCGDAPPFADGNADANSKEAQTKWKSGRFFSDAELTQLATEKHVQVSAVICGSGFNDPEADNEGIVRSYESYLPQARSFFGSLAKATGGGVLDLSQPDVTSQIVKQAQEQRLSFARIGQKITPAEVDEVRLAMSRTGSRQAQAKGLRLAVLPHLPLSQLQDPTAWQPEPSRREQASQIGLLVATELEQKLRLIPGVFVRNAAEVQTAYRTAQRNTSPGNDWERQVRSRLAGVLNVDYLIAGSYRRDGRLVALHSGLYKRVDGTLVAEAEETIELADGGNEVGELNLPAAVFSKLLVKAAAALPDAERAVLARADEDVTLRGQLSQPLSQNLTAQRYLLYGLGSLERSLSSFKGDSSYKGQEVRQLLETAVTDLKAACDHDPENPCAYLFLASCYYNLAASGDPNSSLADYFASLQKAYEYREHTDQTSLQEEIAADYALLIEKNPAQAIEHYTNLTATLGADKANFALRAHWMLAGIYSGDWGVPQEQIDLAKARGHILQILARWEDSPEARFYREHLLDKADPRLPLVANSLLTAMQ